MQRPRTFPATFLLNPPVNRVDGLELLFGDGVSVLASTSMTTVVGTFRKGRLAFWLHDGAVHVGVPTLFLQVTTAQRSYFVAWADEVHRVEAAVYRTTRVTQILLNVDHIRGAPMYQRVGVSSRVFLPTVL